MTSFLTPRLSLCGLVCLLAAAPFAHAQTWTGLGPDNLWATASNWSPESVPGGGATAEFSGDGNGKTMVSLGGGTQPIRDLLFNTASAAAYTIGELPGDTLNFDVEGIILVFSSVSSPQTINATVRTNTAMIVRNEVSNGVVGAPGSGLVGLTLGAVQIGGGSLFVNNGGANVTTVLGGDITDGPGQSGSLSLMATTAGITNNNNFILTGDNTYTGGTTIQVNTGQNGAIYIGTDSPFGTGTVNTILQNNSVEFRALGGTRTISNAFVLDGGINFAGENSFVLNGPLYINSGTSRTLQNKVAVEGETMSLGASPGSSAIYLGNPSTNGGDDVGRTLILGPQPGTTFILNAVVQDPADPNVVGDTARGTLHFGGLAGGTTIVNSLSTYTGLTRLGNGAASIVQFTQDYHAGDPAGPFGLGTFSTHNAGVLQPIGGDRTLANPVLISANAVNSHLTVANAAGDTSSLTLTGPISMSIAGRSIRNLFEADGGILTLGSAANPSTFTLATTAGETLIFSGTGRTVVNHTVQDAPGAATHMDIRDSATVMFNGPQNTNGDLIVRTDATVIMNGNRTGSGDITLTGAQPRLFVHGTKSGGGTVTVGSTSTLSGTGSIDGPVINRGTIAPGSEDLTPGTLTLTGSVTNDENSRWLIGLDGASAGKLVIGGDVDLSAFTSLDVIGSGSGSSWVIATYGGTLTGLFDSVTAGYSVDYGTGANSQITLMLAPVALPGDWNQDGVVDAADYVLWRKDPASHGGDPDGYDLWRQNFGNAAGSGALNGAAVPEPAAVMLLLSAMAALPISRARRRHTAR